MDHCIRTKEGEDRGYNVRKKRGRESPMEGPVGPGKDFGFFLNFLIKMVQTNLFTKQK